MEGFMVEMDEIDRGRNGQYSQSCFENTKGEV